MKLKTEAQLEMLHTLGISQSKKRGKKWKWITAVIVVIAAAVAVFFSLKKPTLASPDLFETRKAERGSLTITVTATGSLQPTNKVDVGSEQSGIVQSVAVTYNDTVKVGQILAKIDPSRLEAQVMQSKANLESAEANVINSQATLTEARNKQNRLKEVWKLSGKKVPSKEELDAAEGAFQRAIAAEATAKAQVSVAQATLSTIETDLSKLIIYSPVDGIVLDRKIEPGQTVAASFQAPVLFTLAEDLSKMELHVDVDEADVGLVKEGQKATFSVDAYPDREFEAKVTQVRFGAKTEQGVVTYETVLTVDNSDLLLRPGMTATADITVNEIKDALLIPNTALRYSPTEKELARFTEKPKAKPGDSKDINANPGDAEDSKAKPETKNQQKVWMIREGKLVQIPVTVGETDRTNTEVKGGEIKAGDLLITNTMSKTSPVTVSAGASS